MQVLRRFSPVFEQVSAGLSMVKNLIDVIKTKGGKYIKKAGKFVRL